MKQKLIDTGELPEQKLERHKAEFIKTYGMGLAFFRDFTQGVSFFLNDVIGTMFYSAVFYGAFYLTEMRFPELDKTRF